MRHGRAMRTASVALLALSIACAAAARATEAPGDSAFLRQYAATQRFTLGRPTALQVTPAGDAVLFLRSGPRRPVRDLYVYDIAQRAERILARADTLLSGSDERLTREERASRERRRLTARGIAGYELSRDGTKVLIPLSGRLFVVERSSGRWKELQSSAGAADAARFSPDGEHVACVRDGDLYVLDMGSRQERRLTHRETPDVTYGLAEFAAQEEMDRFEGYWWSPDSKWLAVERADTRGMERFHIADPAHPEREPDAWPYPRAGGKNAEVRLAILSAGGGEPVWATWDAKNFPYLAHVGWEANAPLTILVQNRAQTEERLLAVDPASGKSTPLLIERDRAWLILWPVVPRWLEDGSGFLWITERHGAPELELHDRRGGLQRSLTAPELGLRRLLDVDQARGIAWVLAGPDPTEQHLWTVPLDPRRGKPVRVTTEPGVYGATFPAAGHGLYVLDVRTLTGAWRQEPWTADGERIPSLRSNAEEPDYLPELELTKVGQGPELRAALVRPRSFERGRRYPVIAHVYGGPTEQMVQADRRRYLIDQWIADHGFVVVCVDGRGTPARGSAWQRAIRGDFATVPLDDLANGLRALGTKYPELDLSRVGIWGGSFGGYFAAMAVMRRPDLFRSAVAVAPVVDWRDYDTHYTERYLGMPDRQAAAYDKSSVLTYASRLDRPLLVVHGLADDNVYVMHTLGLCAALDAAGRDYDFMPLPRQTHMVADSLSTVALYSRLIRHFVRTLEPGR
jgi:dipeptidyl-peptidase-4